MKTIRGNNTYFFNDLSFAEVTNNRYYCAVEDKNNIHNKCWVFYFNNYIGH